MKCQHCNRDMQSRIIDDSIGAAFCHMCRECGVLVLPGVGEFKCKPKGRYVQKAVEIGELVERKQREYGDSWGKAGRILEILYPDGVRPEQYHTFLGITRVIDKLCRLANGNQGEENAWEDLAGYGLLGAVGGEKNVSPDLPEVRKGSGDGDEGDEV